MKTYQFAKQYLVEANAGSKPRIDAAHIMESLGIGALGLKAGYVSCKFMRAVCNRLNKYMAVMRVGSAQAVFAQYPVDAIDYPFLKKLTSKGIKTVYLIHDIDSLRGMEPSHEDLLADASVIIAHTPRMAAWLRRRTEARIITLGVFDFLSPEPENKPHSLNVPPKIVFAGNLAKASFLERINVAVDVYGVNPSKAILANKSVNYRGACSPEELREKLSDYDFGLVWDGGSTDCCSGDFGEYLKYNAPFKLSSYLAASLPVIVWSEMGTAPYVEEHKVGISVESLENLADALSGISKDEYALMRRNAYAEGCGIARGEHYSTAFRAALTAVRT